MSELTHQSVRNIEKAVVQIIEDEGAAGRPISEAVATMMKCSLARYPNLIDEPLKLRIAAEIALEQHATSEWNRFSARFLAN